MSTDTHYRPAPTPRRNVVRAFAEYMMPPRTRSAPLAFKPDYGRWPRPSATNDEQLCFILERGGKRLSAATVLERARTAVHEAAHIVAYILTRNSVRWVRIDCVSRKRRAGEVNSSSHDHVVYEGLHALMGAACELELGLGLDRAEDDMKSARALIGFTAGRYDMPRDDVPEVLELAREFFREARNPINFIALWVLICMPAVGRLEGARLREIVAAARPAVMAAARRIRMIHRLNEIQVRREMMRRALRDSHPKVDLWAALEAIGTLNPSGATRLR